MLCTNLKLINSEIFQYIDKRIASFSMFFIKKIIIIRIEWCVMEIVYNFIITEVQQVDASVNMLLVGPSFIMYLC